MTLQYNIRTIFKEKGKEAKVIIAISDNISQRTLQVNNNSIMNYGKLAKSSICTIVITCPELLRTMKMSAFLMKHLITQTVAIISKVRTDDSIVAGIMIYMTPHGTGQLHYSGRCRIDPIPYSQTLLSSVWKKRQRFCFQSRFT